MQRPAGELRGVLNRCDMAFKVPEQFRLKTGPTRTTRADGNNGHFIISSMKFDRRLFAQAADGGGWEHVSVSVYNRCPTWDEMNYVKNIFWSEDDVVIQIHPSKSDYVNNHPYCLHLWRKAGTNDYVELPPVAFV